MSTFTELKTTQPVDVVPSPSTSPSTTTPDPASLEDGNVPPPETPTGLLLRLSAFVPSTEALKTRFTTIWSSSRPWSEFANTTQMSKPEFIDLMPRIRENFQYYAFNYLVILLILSALTILSSPLSFLGGLFIFVAYMYLFVFNPEPLNLGGWIVVDNNVKAVGIMVFSLVVLWLTGAGATFTGLVVVVAAIATVHAAFRRPQGEADFETAYTPATV